MATITDHIRKIVAKAEPYVPQVPKPKRKLTLQNRLLWTGGALVIYLVMGQTPLFGATAPEFDFLAFARVIFASQQGSLVELGIGPIVTGGLLMQLLRGSDILKFDFKNPAERGVDCYKIGHVHCYCSRIGSICNCSLWSWCNRADCDICNHGPTNGCVNNCNVPR